MRFESNILFSAAVHVAFIAAALFFAGRNAVSRVPEQYVQVTLLVHGTETKVAQSGSKRAAAAISPASVTGMKSSAPEPAPPGIHHKVEAKAKPARDKRAVTRAFHVSAPQAKKQPAAPEVSPPQIHEEIADSKRKLPDTILEGRDLPAGSGRFEAHIFRYPGPTSYGGIVGTVTSTASASLSSVEDDKRGGAVYGEYGTANSAGAIEAIRAAIEKAKRYPLLARRRGMEGTVTAEFSINSRGQPENVRVKASSGFVILDSAAKETIIRAAPFPVIKGSIEIPIAFRLRKEE